MATLPATAVGEVRLTLRLQNGDGTDAPAQGYAWLYPNLREGTRYRASNVDTQVATKTRLVFDTAGNLEDPETNAWAKVLASDAPGATFAGMQWVLEFHLENVERQPSNAYFTVPAGSFVNVGLLADTGSQPAVQTIYTSTAPILAALNTTDSAVANLFSTASTTRTTADARYATTTALGGYVAKADASVSTSGNLPTTGNYAGRSIMALDTGTVWVRNKGNTAWLPFDTEWQSWTPTVANLTVGNGTLVGRTFRQGKAVFGYFEFTMGSTSAFAASSTPSISVPFAARVTSKLSQIGTGWAADVSAGLYAQMAPFLDGAGGVIAPYPMAANGAYVSLTGTFATQPFTWAVGDYFTLNFRYEMS